MDERIEKIREIVREELSHCPGHNFGHVERVLSMAMRLSDKEKVDKEVVELAALLHDIGGQKEIDDRTGNTDHAEESAKMAESILRDLGYKEEKIRHIQDCILSHRYRNEHKPQTKEAEIIFDADKLDALGAIGVARSFIWIGKNKAHMYRKVINMEEYIKDNLGGKIDGRIQDKTKHSPQINFETKIKHIVALLYTEEGRRIGKERTKFFKDFLDRMEREIKGEL